MSISRRAVEIQASPIRKFKPFADQAKARGIHIYHLNIGDPDVPTPKPVFEAFRSFADPVLSYGPAQGFLELRKAVARYYGFYGISLEADDVLVTTGGSEAIHFAFSVVADIGDEIVIPEPYYTNYNGFAAFSAVKIVPVPLHVEDGFRLPPAEEFEKRIGPRTRAILLCSPNNPTGTVYTREEIESIVRLVKKHDLYLIGDEVYKEFVYDGLRHTSIFEFPEALDRVIVVDSISKRFSCCGARIGSLLTKNREVYAAALKFAQARLCPPSVEQKAAEAAYGLPMDYFGPTRAEYQKRRDVLFAGLSEIPGVFVTKPQGAFYLIARLPVADTEDFTRWMLTDFSLDGKTVMVAPASGFYSTPTLGRDEIRIAYVLNVDDLLEALRVFKAGLLKYQELHR